MEQTVDKNQALAQLEKGYSNAVKVLNDKGGLEDLFLKLKRKLREYPRLSGKVADIPVLIDMVKSYVNKTYTQVPVKSIIAIISAFTYLVIPMDLIADFIPVVGLVDDIAVLGICIELIHSDLLDFKAWRNQKNL